MGLLISTHAPLAGRDGDKKSNAEADLNFNPRAPCGARPQMLLDVMQRTIFQPTRPLRGATS